MVVEGLVHDLETLFEHLPAPRLYRFVVRLTRREVGRTEHAGVALHMDRGHHVIHGQRLRHVVIIRVNSVPRVSILKSVPHSRSLRGLCTSSIKASFAMYLAHRPI